MRKKAAPAPAATHRVAAGEAIKVGWLTAGSTPAAPTVDFEGNASGPLKARTIVAFDAPSIAQAIATRQGALLLFENGDSRLPIVVGLVSPEPGAALFASLLRPETSVRDATGTPDARLEGRRVTLEGDTEVVLRCGDASITLRRDGKVILRGAYIETTAKGVNRIRGGSVKIN